MNSMESIQTYDIRKQKQKRKETKDLKFYWEKWLQKKHDWVQIWGWTEVKKAQEREQ